ncbi:MAG: GlyGly-CTERM sorting domain-containing protein [Candidatus Helarchaeota archaeon]|nr:GlyGly-CTERM sorting domain-containing protein [Candidatus Helarchaeota archaeon]
MVFLGLSLFFPFWNDSTTIHQFISLWRLSISGIPFYHWEVFSSWASFGFILIFSIIALNILVLFIILIVKNLLKRTFFGTSLFWLSFILMPVFGLLFPLMIGFDFLNLGSSLYGPTWGLAFGWWALLIAGILGLIRKYYSDMLEREKEEEEE